MTSQEFQRATAQQTRVLDEIQRILRDNAMSLSADVSGDIWLCDDGRDIGNTGYLVQGKAQ